MRIDGGDFGGRKLAHVGKGDAKNALRPTTDRLREALFNVLGGGRYGDPISGVNVLDLFAGTGALGLEALSRGAAHATFVESGRVGQGLIADNIAAFDQEDRARLIRKDATRLGPVVGDVAKLVFLDPPYGKDLGHRALIAALEGGWIAPDAMVIWEEASAMDAPAGFTVQETRAYGSTVFTFLNAT